MKSFIRFYDETENNEENLDKDWNIQLVHSSQLQPLSDEPPQEQDNDD